MVLQKGISNCCARLQKCRMQPFPSVTFEDVVSSVRNTNLDTIWTQLSFSNESNYFSMKIIFIWHKS